MRWLRREDTHSFVRLERLIKNFKSPATLAAGQRIGHFRDYPNRGQQRTVVSILPSQGLLMALIGSVDRGKEEKRVAKDRFHAPARLGVPWM